MSEKKQATIGQALIVLIPTCIFLIYAIVEMAADAHIPLLFGAVLCSFLGLKLGYTWKDLEEAIIKAISLAMPAILILMTVGMLIGSWIASGVVPTMIYYGLQVINPAIFLAVAFILCMITSLAIGTSWGTAGTVGVALMGIGSGFGIPVAMVGGAVISGAYFGDKLSPLSDTTNLTSVSAGVPLFEHVKFMLRVTVPATLIALVLFFVVGMQFTGDTVGDIPALLEVMRANFNINPVLLLPPIFIIAIIALKVPPLPGILAGAVVAVPLFFIFQMNMQYDSFAAACAGIVDNLHYGFSIDTDNDTVNSLFNRGGLHRKMWAISLVMVAMVFGGVMEKTGCLKSITEALIKFAKGIGSLTVVSMLSAIVGNLITADQYLSLILPGRMYRVEYIKRGYHTKNLGRTLEAGGTLTSALIPWNSCGATMIVTLGLTAWTYVPFAFFNLACIALTLIYAFVGFSVAKLTDEEKAEMLAAAEAEM